MSGTRTGAIKTRDTNKQKYGEDYYVRLGALGGKAGNTGGFASTVIGRDGLDGRARAVIAGQLGGRKSRRTKKDIVKPLLVTIILAGLCLAAVPSRPADAYASSNPYENYIIQHESGGDPTAVNPYSGACGLMQAYPCSKLESDCPDWPSDIPCQLDFFHVYAATRYRYWHLAAAFWQLNGWW